MQKIIRRQNMGFVSANYEKLGMAESTLYSRIQLYDAIVSNTFDERLIIL